MEYLYHYHAKLKARYENTFYEEYTKGGCNDVNKHFVIWINIYIQKLLCIHDYMSISIWQ